MQRRLTPAANQLKYLHNKFDFANAARAELDVIFQPPATNFTRNHPLHIAQRLDHTEVDITAEDEWAQHGAQFIDITTVGIAHDPRLDHRVALPVAPLLLVIIFQRRKTQHQRAAVAKRTQPHVHPIDKTILGRLIQNLDQPLSHACKKLRVIEFAASPLGRAVLRPGKDQIDVRRKIQLTAAQFAHAQNQQRLWDTVLTARRSPFPTAGVVQPVARADDQRFGQMA